jgi:hypothetical protein
MLWFFERHESRLRYEIRRQSDGEHYELVITHPDGREEIEVYTDAGAVVERSQLLESALTAEGWQSPGGRSRPPAPPHGSSRASS